MVTSEITANTALFVHFALSFGIDPIKVENLTSAASIVVPS